MRGIWRMLTFAMLAVIAVGRVHGQVAGSNDTLRQMNLKVWAVADGAPADIWDMKQDPQGFMWLATGGGLFRFDGLRFDRYIPVRGEHFRSEDMTSLLVQGNDDLWVGTNDGYIAHVQNGRITTFPSGDRPFDGSIFSLAIGPTGDVWAAAVGAGLLRVRGDTVLKMGPAQGFPEDLQPTRVLVDDEGSLWVATSKELMVLPKGTDRFQHTGIVLGGYPGMTRAADGTVWVSDWVYGTRGFPHLSAGHIPTAFTGVPPPTHFGWGRRMTLDASGALWMNGRHSNASGGIEGVYRIPNASRLATGRALESGDVSDIFTKDDGLPSAIIGTLLVDASGDVWVTTNFGLASFHPARFHPFEPNADHTSQVWLSPASNGRIFATQAGCLYRVEGVQPTALRCDAPVGPTGVLYAHDSLYSFTTSIRRLGADGSAETLPEPPSHAWDGLTSFAVDGQGDGWLASRFGLFRWHDHRWSSVVFGPPALMQPVAVTFDRNDVLWMGYADGTMARYDGHHVRRYGASEGLAIGLIEAIDSTGPEVLVGGATGAAILHHGRFASLPMARLHIDGRVSGAAMSSIGDWWLNTTRGVIRIARGQLEAFLADPTIAPEYRLYSASDGLNGIAMVDTLWPTLTTDGDGRLWVTTNQGVAWTDPNRVEAPAIPPTVHLDTLSVNGEQWPLAGAMMFPVHTTNVAITYTAPTFRSPLRMQFLYRLDGVDATWHDGGVARQATYTNLAPGRYTFQIVAISEEGVRSTVPTRLDFEIPPAFYQTVWFRVGVLLLILGLIIVVAVMAHRAALRRAKDRIDARHAERERIARDLHDTLLQSAQGLLLCCQAVAGRLQAGDPLQLQVDRSIDRAQQTLIEGRRHLQALRVPSEGAEGLVARLMRYGTDLTAEHGLDFALDQSGLPRDLVALAADEAVSIVREAILNACQHARGTAVVVELSFSPDRLTVHVDDDGVGIPADRGVHDEKPGHFGLTGMRERARTIGGELAITQRTPRGTRVSLTVPAGAIYFKHPKGSTLMAWLKQLGKPARDSEPS